MAVFGAEEGERAGGEIVGGGRIVITGVGMGGDGGGVRGVGVGGARGVELGVVQAEGLGGRAGGWVIVNMLRDRIDFINKKNAI